MNLLQNRAHREVFFILLVATVAIITLALQNIYPHSSWSPAFDCFRWTTDCLAYVVMAFVAFRASEGINRSIKGWIFAGWLLYGLGQIIMDGELAAGVAIYATWSDLFYLALTPCLTIGLINVLMRDLTVGMKWAVLLDIIGIAVIATTLTLALYIPNNNEQSIPVMTTITLSAYAIGYFVALGVLIITILFKKIVFNWDSGLLILGLIVHSFCWLVWNLEISNGQSLYGSWVSYAYSVGSILLVLGCTRWTGATSDDPNYQKLCWRFQRLLPLLLVSAAAIATIFGRYHANPNVRYFISFGALTMVVLAIIRQSLLLYERESTLQAQKKLSEQEANLKTLIEYSNDVIFRVGIDEQQQHRYLSLSHGFEELTGIEIKKAIGKSPYDVFPKMTADNVTQNYQRCANEKNPIRYEQLVTTFNNAIWFDTMLIPLKNEQNEVTEIIGVSRNITASKSDLEAIKTTNAQLEQIVFLRTEQVQNAYREMEMFSYSVSHDLRTPLRGINGFCEAFREDYGDSLDAEARKHLDRIYSSSQRMGQIIDDLLQLSRVSRSQLAIAEVNLSQMAAKIAENLQSMDPQRKVRFAIVPNLTVQCDARLLELAFDNLLGNAWKYTSRHPTALIEFGVEPQGTELVFFIRDDGAGFDMEYAHKLFQAFQRLHDRTEFEGIGIGLAIVSRILQRHRGRIWAQGAPEKGATFYFTLPPQKPTQT